MSANDKPTVLSKPVVGDAAEQRLKTEVMQIPARDRRRLKEVQDVSATLKITYGRGGGEGWDGEGCANLKIHDIQGDITDPLNHSVAVSIHDYLSSKQIKLPDSVPASAGGLNKTSKPPLPLQRSLEPPPTPLPYTQPPLPSTPPNPQLTIPPIDWDPEIRKHYTQPLHSETLEFPDLDTLTQRMRPICFEESLPHGFSPPCPEYLATATEQYLKDVMGAVLVRTRSNVGVAGIRTEPKPNFKNAETEKEKEMERRPLSGGDLRFALGRGEVGFGQRGAVARSVMGGWGEGVLEGWGLDVDSNGDEKAAKMNGSATRALTNGTYPEEADDGWGWEGGGKTGRMRLGGLLDECLAIGQ